MGAVWSFENKAVEKKTKLSHSLESFFVKNLCTMFLLSSLFEEEEVLKAVYNKLSRN